MTDLAQTALGFARECMGWERPVDRRFAEQNRDPHGNPSKVWSPYVFEHSGKQGQFHYTNLNAVMAAARCWMTGKVGSVSVHCFDGEVFVAVAISDSQLEVRSEPLTDPCQALMAACVEAARKLKEGA